MAESDIKYHTNFAMYNKEFIQSNLLTIGSNTFQKLCTDIIFYKYQASLLSIEATGSQIGKDSTIKGVPDIYFYTEDDQFVFIEATTQKKSLKKKFINDINGCLKKIRDKEISIDNISSIWLMFSSRIGIDLEVQIRNEFKQYTFTLKFINIDSITDALINAPYLLQDYLNISADIGYVVPTSYFAHNYDKRINQFATPLDNPFYNREKELKEIKNKIINNNILIIKGDAGVGKTKLAIEAMESFCKDNLAYKSYAIGGYQSNDVTYDLYSRIRQEKDVILLIDDANQKKNSLENILKSIYNNTAINIKLVLTVRQYAFQEIIHLLDEIDIIPLTYSVDKFTREELSNIISNAPFLIKDRNTQDQILGISKGNPRLAIMGAKAINENQNSELFIDTLSLYDQYFRKTITELEKTTEKKILIKVLGLVSTFNTIKLESEDHITKRICEVFDINFKELNQTIETLEEKEFLEIHSKFKRAKICEQITYTYFFYRLFINKAILPLNILLNEFYPMHSPHISGLINAVTDTFGEQELIKNSLKGYFQSVQQYDSRKDEIIHILFSNHSNFLYDELFLCINEEINSKPLNENKDLIIYDKEHQGWLLFDYKYWNIILRFISENDNEQIFETALSLMLEYIRRFPELYNSFVYYVRNNQFSSNKKYQIYFLSLLKNRDDVVCKSLFLEFANSFLDTLGRGESEIYRKNTWETLFYYYQFEREKVEEILIEYFQISNHYLVEVLNNDLNILLPFIESKYEMSDFRIIYWMNEYFNMLDNYNGIDKRKYKVLRTKYSIPSLYTILNWNKLKGEDKDQTIEDLGWKKYDEMKKEEINALISINSIADFEPIIEALKDSYLINSRYLQIERSIRIILSNVLEANLSLGIELIHRIIKQFPRIKYIVHLPINLIKTKRDINVINKYIESLDGKHYIEAKYSFLYTIPKEFLNKRHAEEFINLFELSPTLSFQVAERFLEFDSNIYNSILSIIVSKNIDGNSIKIDDRDIEKYINHLTNVSNLITFYFQQKEIDSNFDDSNKIFLHIFLLKEQFLIDCIEFFNLREKLHDKLYQSEYLAKIWEHPKIEELISSLFQMYKEDRVATLKTILETKYYRLRKEMFIPLFSLLNETQQAKALCFLLAKLEEQKDFIQMVNLILFIARQMGNDVFKTILHRYIEFDSDLNSFKQLDLFSTHASIFGSGTFGDIYANRWKNILEILSEFPNKFITISLISYAKTMMKEYLDKADDERENEYMGYR